MSTEQRRVEIVIDELVLRGVPAEHAPAVEAALRLRLHELAVVGPSGPMGDRAEASRRLADITVTAGDPARLGRVVAESVWADVAGVRSRAGGAP